MEEWVYKREYEGKEWGANYTKENTSGFWVIPESNPFKVPAVTEEEYENGLYSWQWEEEFANFYSSDNYEKDETTNLMMAAPTEETCKANNGFVCKVRQ